MTAGARRCHPKWSSSSAGSSAGSSAAALNEPPSAVTTDVEHLATRAMEHHLERRLKSVTLLDRA